MLSLEWQEDGWQDEVFRRLARDAAVDDAEMGFTELAEAGSVLGPSRAQLSVSLARDQQSSLAACADIRWAAADEATGVFVVHPAFRSLGVATLLAESLGLRPGGCLPCNHLGIAKLNLWAAGDHPAAYRLGHRFRLPVVRKVSRFTGALHRLADFSGSSRGCVRPGWSGEFDLAGATKIAADGHARLVPSAGHRRISDKDLVVDFVGSRGGSPSGLARLLIPESATTDGPQVGVVDRLLILGGLPDAPGLAADLVRVCFRAALEHGCSHIEIAVPSDRPHAIRLCRSLGLVSDQTDTCYQLTLA